MTELGEVVNRMMKKAFPSIVDLQFTANMEYLLEMCIRDSVWIMASESCAITSVGGEFIRDIEPGEIVTITRDGVFSDKSLQQEKRAHCVFEYIYFARLDSHIDDVRCV